MDREIIRRAGGDIEDDDGLLMFAAERSDVPFIANGVMRLDTRISALETLDRAREFAARFGRTAGVVTHARDADLDAALGAAGWRHVVTLEGMVAVEPIVPARPGAGIELNPVGDAELLRTMVLVLGEAFGPEEPWPSLWSALFNEPSTIDPPDVAAVLAHADGEPAAAAVAYALEPVNVVGVVGALPRFSGRGLGDLVTREVASAVQARNGRPVALQSSPMARPLYERIGFKAVTTYGVWLDSAA